MITIEEGLIYGLKANAGIAALVGVRVYGERKPQEAALPCITTQRISTVREHTHDSAGSAGTAHPRMQIDVWAETRASAKAITDAVRAYLNGFKGAMGDPAGSPVTVQSALIDNEAPEYDGDTGIYRCRCDYIIWHLET